MVKIAALFFEVNKKEVTIPLCKLWIANTCRLGYQRLKTGSLCLKKDWLQANIKASERILITILPCVWLLKPEKLIRESEKVKTSEKF